MPRPVPDPVGPDEESVWDYPRPPALERLARPVRVVLGGERIVDAPWAWRVLETSHPPQIYIDPAFFTPGALVPAEGSSFCEWKGRARYFDVRGGGQLAARAAWSYPEPTARFAGIAGCVALYAGPMDACFVGDERVTPQPGGFYGGWITPNIKGPFKGGPGTWGW